MTILVIGSTPSNISVSTSPHIGGTTVLLNQLVEELSLYRNISVKTIDTSGIRNKNLKGIGKLLKCMGQIFIEVFRNDVISAHFSDGPLANLGLYIVLVSKLASRPIIIRKFGGSDYMQTLGPFLGTFAHFTLRNADLYLAETKQLVALAKENKIPHVEWYSNSRPMKVQNKQPLENNKVNCRHFVYIGQVKKTKGIQEIIEASKYLPMHSFVDIYGPFLDDLTEEYFKEKPGVKYCGILNPNDVLTTLSQYDALLLPTYHFGEGYPGIIIEAYTAGIPVISTYWRAVPEIVDETSGILIMPGDAAALFKAMLNLVENDAHYQKLCLGASKRAKEFDSLQWTEIFVKFCHNLRKN